MMQYLIEKDILVHGKTKINAVPNSNCSMVTSSLKFDSLYMHKRVGHILPRRFCCVSNGSNRIIDIGVNHYKRKDLFLLNYIGKERKF